MDRRRFRFGPHPSAGVILGLRVSHLAGIVVAGVAGLVIMRTFRAPLNLGLVLVDFGVMLLAVGVKLAGKTAIEWIPVGVMFAVARLDGTLSLRSKAPQWGTWLEFPTTGRKDARAVISLPAELSDVEILEGELRGSPFGVAKDKRARTYTATVRCTATGFHLLGEEERLGLLAQFGSLLAGFASDESPVRRLAWYERTVPSGRVELRDNVQEHLRRLPDGHVGRVATEQLLAAQGRELEHEALFSIQVAEPAGDRFGLVTLEQEAGRLIDELARLGVIDAQPVGARSVAVPDARELARVIRDGLDPWTALEREQAPAFSEPGIEPERFGPIARDGHWSHVTVDGSIHVVGHLLEFPRRDVGATFLSNLLAAGQTVRTIALVMNVLGPRAGTRRAERQAEEASAESWLRDKIGRRTTARDRAREGHVSLREEELAAGHCLVSFAGFVGVSVPESAGPATAQREFDSLQAQALRAGLRLERMRGEMIDALTYVLPLCRGLR